MKCPNCQEIDQPHGAAFCHACGEPLPLPASRKIARQFSWHIIRTRSAGTNGHSKPFKSHNSSTFLSHLHSSWQRLLCTKNPQWLYKKVCSAVGAKAGNGLSGMSWCQAVRYLLLFAVIIECLTVSIIEFPVFDPWGQITIFTLNVPTVILTTRTCISANMFGLYEDKGGAWRIYYNWLHFLLSAAIPFVGYMAVNAYQNFFTLMTDFLLCGALLLMDSGTIEALTCDR